MSLNPGTKLGPYEILAPLGAGGMGEVYKAKDTRLDRTVAIKVLPSHVASNPEVRQRFEREARAVSSLNHPHICTLHDIGRENDIDFMVMEHIEGDTLADRLNKGALPLDQALQYGIQIADALDKAHRQGVVHRDLKPGNIMLTKSGAKLLDFGLAKMAVSGSSPDLSGLATEAQPLTEQGTILGTFQYMSPEQLEGKEADSRTDIFAFGAVLYEMLTGRKAFEGKSQASLIAAILDRDPPAISSLEPMTPAGLDYVVNVCVSKDPDDRWQSARDLLRELKRVEAGGAVPTEPASAPAVPPPVGWSRAIPWVAGMVAASIVTGLAVWSLMRPGPQPTEFVARSLVRFAMPTMPGSDPFVFGNTMHDVAISPDGTRVVHATNFGPGTQLVVHALDQLSGTVLQGLSNQVGGPFISPDSAWVGFFDGSDDTLKKVSMLGGPAVPISGVRAPALRGASWGTDGMIIFGTSVPSGLWRVSADGGEPQELTSPNPAQAATNHAWPEILPGGRAVLFTVLSSDSSQTAQIAVRHLETGEESVLIPGGSYPRYVSTGHIVYVTDDTLRAVPFDLDRLEITGNPVPVLDDVVTKVGGAADFSLSQDGSLAYLTGAATSFWFTLVWVDREGREETVPAEARFYVEPDVSPDGTRVAVTVRDSENRDVWIWNQLRRTLTRLTTGAELDEAPLWTPDGTRVVFQSTRDGGGLFWQAADGTGGVERLLESSNGPTAWAWSADGRLVFVESAAGGRDIGVLTVEGDRGTETLLATEFGEQRPVISPDGRWLAYQSDESGQFEIYVRPFPNVDDGRWVVSAEGGQEPVWSPDGRELFYVGQGNLNVVPIETEPTFSHGTPEIVFGIAGYAFDVSARNYDVSPDGQRFLMLKLEAAQTTDSAEPFKLIVVLNWFEELKRLVPTN